MSLRQLSRFPLLLVLACTQPNPFSPDAGDDGDGDGGSGAAESGGKGGGGKGGSGKGGSGATGGRAETGGGGGAGPGGQGDAGSGAGGTGAGGSAATGGSASGGTPGSGGSAQGGSASGGVPGGGGAAGGKCGAGGPQPEICFNGEDDDCDGQPDCADSDCAEVTMCVPDPGDFKLGVRLPTPTGNCPTDYANPTTLRTADDRAASCNVGGCKCNGSIQCESVSVRAYYCPYGDPSETNEQHVQRCISACKAYGEREANYSIDKSFTDETGKKCNDLNPPSGDVTDAYDPWGIHLMGGGVKQRSCSVSGSASLPALTYTREARLCEVAKRSAAGCAPGKICVAKATAAVCAYATGQRACPGGYGAPDSDWYTGYGTGSRACTACSCGSASGGSCPTEALFGSDGTCGKDGVNSQGNLNVSLGQLKCVTDYNLHNPNFRFASTPQNPSCGTPKSMVTGSPAGQGQHTICCM